MRPLYRPLYRAATWALVAVLLASTLVALLGNVDAASTTTYTVTGFADQPGAPTAAPVPVGVTVDLVSRATGAVYTTTTTSGGQFKFTESGTSNALAPGYWGLYVPTAADASISGCLPYRCAVLPQQQTPTYQFFSASMLKHPGTNTQLLQNVLVAPYNATLNVTAKQGGAVVGGATIKLLAPTFGGLTLNSNTTNSKGFANLTVPFGTWTLQVTHTSGSGLYSSTTTITVSAPKPAPITETLSGYSISGRIVSSKTGGYITTTGNASLFDPSTSALYGSTTPPGGYYAFSSYDNKEFYVILAPSGYQTVWYAHNVTNATPYQRTVTAAPIQTSEEGLFSTVLDFKGISTTTGKGDLAVYSNITLGNDSVLPGLPNATVGQLWAQLGLDFDHSIAFSWTGSSAALKTWLADQGPFFPAVQAGTTVNGTAFLGPKAAQGTTNFTFSSTCTTSCGVASGKSLDYSWSNLYPLNGTLVANSDSYTISFHFAHPVSTADVYNYTVKLPKGYALSAGTTAPANTNLTGTGPKGTWTTFSLLSRAAATSAATATFTIVKVQNVTAAMSVTSKNAFFSSANVLNSTRNYYTVVLGAGVTATYSAAPTTYPAGENGSTFVWNFGDGSKPVSTSNVTTNHTYAGPNGTSYYAGTLKVISSSGATSNASFKVWIVTSKPTAVISSNATKNQTFQADGTTFLVVNWSTTLHFSANNSAPAKPNVLAIAQYTLRAKNYTATQNYSETKGANASSNWSVAFGANTTNSKTAPGHGLYLNFANIKIGTAASGVTGWGWEYNLTLTVWTVVGTTSATTLTILVKDTEPPVPKIQLISAATGKTITSGSIVEGPKHYVVIHLAGNESVDYGNGSIVKWNWNITNPGNTTAPAFKNISWSNTSAKPNGKFPTVRLYPKTTDYKIRLTVTDKAGNKANTTTTLSVSENTTLRPVMEANNLTGPSTVNAGSKYTYWLNVTVGGGAKAKGTDVTVSFYLLGASGTGTRNYIAGTPGSVNFYGYSNKTKNATVNSTVLATGSIPTLAHGRTVRAVITWTPGKSGSFILYAAAKASNQFVNNTTESIASMSITVHPNPTTTLLEDAGIVAAVVVVIAVLVLYFRRRTRKPGTAKPSTGRSGLERSSKPADDDDE